MEPGAEVVTQNLALSNRYIDLNNVKLSSGTIAYLCLNSFLFSYIPLKIFSKFSAIGIVGEIVLVVALIGSPVHCRPLFFIYQ